jgi:ubiquinone/menaquinone biosynthesis C-methylase UbiE
VSDPEVAKLDAERLAVEWLEADAKELPFGDSSFDTRAATDN